MVNQFNILVQSLITDLLDSEEFYGSTQNQINLIRNTLKEMGGCLNDIQILCLNDPVSQIVANTFAQAYNPLKPIQTQEKIFPIYSLIKESKIKYDRTFFFRNFKKNKYNWELLAFITRQGVLKIIQEQSEVTIIIVNKRFFDQEWPYAPENGFCLDIFGNLIFSQEIPIGPIIFDCRNLKITHTYI